MNYKLKLNDNFYFNKITNKLINYKLNKDYIKFYNIKYRYLTINEELLLYKYFIKDYKIDLKSFIENYNKNKYSYSILYPYIDKIKLYFEKEFEELIDINLNPFISYNILKYIQNNIKQKYIYKNNNINLKIFTENNIDLLLLDDIHNIINFFNDIFNYKNDINIIIFLTPFKKKIQKEFIPETVNSGSCIKNKKIVIWRIEEVCKVLIHELLHYCNIDIHDDYYISNKLKKEINLEFLSNLNPNEAYTESIALILYTYYNTLKINNNIFNIYIFENLFNDEIIFSIKQCCKIIKHFNCFNNYEDIFITSKKCNTIQYTSIFSYFIIKTSLIFDLNYFLNFIKIINNNSFKFINTQKNYYYFYKYIINSLKNKKFIQIINKNLNNLTTNNTMRMTHF